jgi:hypothetical protein
MRTADSVLCCLPACLQEFLELKDLLEELVNLAEHRWALHAYCAQPVQTECAGRIMQWCTRSHRGFQQAYW